MSKAIKHISLFLLLLLLIGGVAIYIFRKPLVIYFMPTVQQVGDIQILVKNDTSFISSLLSVKNNSFLKIGIDSLKYKVSLFDKVYMQYNKAVGLVLLPYEKDTVALSLKIPYLQIIKDLKAERKKGDSASYSILIKLKYSTLFGMKEIPIHKTAKLRIPQPPEIKVLSLKWTKVRWKTLNALAQIQIVNYSPIALTVKNMNYSMNILNQGKLHGKYSKPIHIKPKATSQIYLPIQININNVAKTAYKILLNKDTYKYTLKINTVLESTDPVNETFHVNMIKSGMLELQKGSLFKRRRR